MSILAATLISIAAVIMVFATKNKLVNLGTERVLNDGKRIKATQEILGGIRSIKLAQNMNIFLKKYSLPNYIFAKAGRDQAFLQLLPRIWFELLLVSTLISIAIFLLSNGERSIEIIPLFALYAGAGFRMLPSISRMVASNQSIRFTFEVAKNISNIFRSEETNLEISYNNIDLTFEEKIEFKNVSFSYPRSETKILDNVSLAFSKGEFIGISGPSGSGKTTFLDILTGLIHPNEGFVLSDGITIETNIPQWQSKIAYVEQNTFLIDSSIAENIAFGLDKENIDFDRVNTICEKIGLKNFIDGLPNNVNHFVGERGVSLSGGQLQRIGIARALYRDSEILVLDEITSSLDKENEDSILELINKFKGEKTIFLISHNMRKISRFDYIISFQDGEIKKII